MNKENERAVRRFQGMLPYQSGKRTVLDVGSRSVDGQKMGAGMWSCARFEYWGVDMEAGENVDEVVPGNCCWHLGRQFDVVTCLSCLEHCETPWRLMETLASHVKPGGYLLAIAPQAWIQHRYPVDCYRYLPDGMKALAEYVGLEVVEAYSVTSKPWNEMFGWWLSFLMFGIVCKETVLTARKPL